MSGAGAQLGGGGVEKCHEGREGAQGSLEYGMEFGGGPLGGEEEERQGASAWRWGWKDGGGTQG